MKLKTLLHTIIFPHLCRLTRTLSNAKSILIHLLKQIQLFHFKGKKKLFLGSFRLHYNWGSSHVMPVPSPTSHVYCDPTWSSFIGSEGGDMAEARLSGYLHWLEEENSDNCNVDDEVNEIDRLADMFIERCHEKFRLEKQESYRRFQEMMARSI
ncbi:hypothetical protein LguiB_004439 [Lonicera macranthoides]